MSHHIAWNKIASKKCSLNREHHQYLCQGQKFNNTQKNNESTNILCFLAIISSPTRLLTTKIIIPQILNLFNSVFILRLFVNFKNEQKKDFWLKINLYVDVMEYIMEVNGLYYFWWNLVTWSMYEKSNNLRSFIEISNLLSLFYAFCIIFKLHKISLCHLRNPKNKNKKI